MTEEVKTKRVYLTKRQIQAFELYKEGFNQKEIGMKMGICQSSVSQLLSRIREIMGANYMLKFRKDVTRFPFDLEL